ncbi:hypothetical protein ACS0TY_011016 [Phlomoides rotata]
MQPPFVLVLIFASLLHILIFFFYSVYEMLRVGDLDRSIKFYEKALGMRLLKKTDRAEQKFAFSLGKRVVDPFRSSLSPKMVEELVCTSDWLKTDEMNFYKDPTDDDLELYKEIEDGV